MSVSRRTFLRSGAVVSAALVLKPSTFVFGNNPITSNSAATISKPEFSFTRAKCLSPMLATPSAFVLENK